MGKSSAPQVTYETSPYAGEGASLLNQMQQTFGTNYWKQGNLLNPSTAQQLAGSLIGNANSGLIGALTHSDFSSLFANSFIPQIEGNRQNLLITEVQSNINAGFTKQDEGAVNTLLGEINNNNLLNNTLQNNSAQLSALGLANTPALQNANAFATASVLGQEANATSQLTRAGADLTLLPYQQAEMQNQITGQQLQQAEGLANFNQMTGIRDLGELGTLQQLLQSQLMLPYQAQLGMAQAYMGVPSTPIATQQQSILPTIISTGGMLGIGALLGGLL